MPGTLTLLLRSGVAPVSSRVKAMGRGKVRLRELPVLVSELEEKGASDVRRRPARFDGWVEVTWHEPESSMLKSSDFSTDVLPWIPAYVLGGIYLVFVVVVFVIIGRGLG